MSLHARVLTVELGPGMCAEGEALAERWTAGAAALPGFVDVWFFGDDEAGRYGYFSLWESREAAENAARAIGSQVLGALLAGALSPPVVRIYEVYEPRHRDRGASRRKRARASLQPRLLARTPEARAALGGFDSVTVNRLPFRVGREARLDGDGRARDSDRRDGKPPINDCYLIDLGERKQISRRHFAIERSRGGGFEAVDLGSHCGLTVGEQRLGPEAASRCALRPGDTLVVGTDSSRYVFVFESPATPPPVRPATLSPSS